MFANLKTKSHTKKEIDLTYWQYTPPTGTGAASVAASRNWGTNTDADDNVYMPISVLKEYLDLARDEDLEKIPVRSAVAAVGGGTPVAGTLEVTKQQLKDLQEKLKTHNYQNFVDKRYDSTEATLVLFEGNWKDGKLTVARITDCDNAAAFSIFYNDREQVEDDASVQNAVQFLRTPLYAYCMGN